MPRPHAVRRRAAPAAAAPVSELTRVGNLGCIRFPLAIRKASGIKRGHRLAVSGSPPQGIVLSRIPDGMDGAALSVEQCACQQAPGGCQDVKPYLEVGWSYVQFDAARAQALGLLPGAPLRLVAEPFRITVQLEPQGSARQRSSLPVVKCPP